jgi:hypothetical protein
MSSARSVLGQHAGPVAAAGPSIPASHAEIGGRAFGSVAGGPPATWLGELAQLFSMGCPDLSTIAVDQGHTVCFLGRQMLYRQVHTRGVTSYPLKQGHRQRDLHREIFGTATNAGSVLDGPAGLTHPARWQQPSCGFPKPL